MIAALNRWNQTYTLVEVEVLYYIQSLCIWLYDCNWFILLQLCSAGFPFSCQIHFAMLIFPFFYSMLVDFNVCRYLLDIVPCFIMLCGSCMRKMLPFHVISILCGVIVTIFVRKWHTGELVSLFNNYLVDGHYSR